MIFALFNPNSKYEDENILFVNNHNHRFCNNYEFSISLTFMFFNLIYVNLLIYLFKIIQLFLKFNLFTKNNNNNLLKAKQQTTMVYFIIKLKIYKLYVIIHSYII